MNEKLKSFNELLGELNDELRTGLHLSNRLRDVSTLNAFDELYDEIRRHV